MKTPKKLVLLITKSNWGGAQRYVYDVAVHCRETYDVTVLHGGNGDLVQKLHDAGVTCQQIPALQRDISLLAELRAIWQTYRILKKLAPDILHIHSSKAGVYGSVIGRWLRIPRIVFTAHGWAFNEDRHRLSKLIFRLMYWCVVWCSHTTITVSHTLADQLHLPFGNRKLTCVPLAITPPHYHERKTAQDVLRETSSAPAHGIWLGTVAELHPVKNHRVIIEALPQLLTKNNSLHYIVVGDGQEKVGLEELATELGVLSHVHFTGHIDEAGRYMKAFDLFILPSLSEAAGYVLHEAGHADVPIIASHVGGIPELIFAGRTGALADPKDKTTWVATIASFIETPATFYTQSDTLHSALDSYTLEDMLRGIESVYEHKVACE